MLETNSMMFPDDTAAASDPEQLASPVTVQASGHDIARQLIAMREAARAAGLAKVVLCLDYAYYEALQADRPRMDESAEAI